MESLTWVQVHSVWTYEFLPPLINLATIQSFCSYTISWLWITTGISFLRRQHTGGKSNMEMTKICCTCGWVPLTWRACHQLYHIQWLIMPQCNLFWGMKLFHSFIIQFTFISMSDLTRQLDATLRQCLTSDFWSNRNPISFDSMDPMQGPSDVQPSHGNPALAFNKKLQSLSTSKYETRRSMNGRLCSFGRNSNLATNY